MPRPPRLPRLPRPPPPPPTKHKNMFAVPVLHVPGTRTPGPVYMYSSTKYKNWWHEEKNKNERRRQKKKRKASTVPVVSVLL